MMSNPQIQTVFPLAVLKRSGDGTETTSFFNNEGAFFPVA